MLVRLFTGKHLEDFFGNWAFCKTLLSPPGWGWLLIWLQYRYLSTTVWLLLNCCFLWEGLLDSYRLVSSFLTYEFFCASCGPLGTPEAQVAACCVGPLYCERHKGKLTRPSSGAFT